MSKLPLSKDAQIKKLSRELVRDSIIEDAASRFVEMVLKEAHDSRIKPLQDRIEELEAKLAKAVEAANFLSDRLNEFDLTDDADDMCRNFIGHIEPAHARMCAAIAEINGGGDE